MSRCYKEECILCLARKTGLLFQKKEKQVFQAEMAPSGKVSARTSSLLCPLSPLHDKTPFLQ